MIQYFEETAAELALLTDRQRLEYVIQKGQQVDGLSDDERTDENKVEGCQSDAYLIVEHDNGVVVRTDADSKVVRGYLAFLSEGLTGLSIETVISEAETSVKRFVDKGELAATFTPNRSDAFSNTVDAIVAQCENL